MNKYGLNWALINGLAHDIEVRLAGKIELMPDDNDGRRPVGSWAVISSDGSSEFETLFGSVESAIMHADHGDQVAFIPCNTLDDGSLSPGFEASDGMVYTYDEILTWEGLSND